MRRYADDPSYSPPFVMPAKLRPEIEAALRQVLSDYRAGRVASFMTSEEEGEVVVLVLKPDVVRAVAS